MDIIASSRCHIIIFLGSFLLTSCIKTKELPVVNTFPVSAINGGSATGGGEISDDGGAAIKARGVCWSTGTLNLPAAVTFEYGITENYEYSVSASEGLLNNDESNVSAAITGLN